MAASGKQRLQGLLSPSTKSSAAAGSAGHDEATTSIQRGTGFTVSTADIVNEPLPEAVQALRSDLRDIARNYLGARRRIGRALLEAARWLSEARSAAEHGEWYEFLAATETTPDTAERLLRIYERALQHPAFAEAVAEGRVNQSVAERLARESTPIDVLEAVLTAEQAPSVADVERAIRAARSSRPQTGAQIPQIAGSGELGGQIPQFAGSGGAGTQIPQFAGSGGAEDPHTVDLLRELAALIASLAHRPGSVPASAEVRSILDALARDVATLRNALDQQ